MQKKIRRFHLSSINKLAVTNDTYVLDIDKLENKFENAINANFDIYQKAYEIQLFATKNISNIIQMKPISKTQQILQKYDDGSVDLSVWITNDDELIPTIKKYMPHLKVINNDRIDKKIKEQFDLYFS